MEHFSWQTPEYFHAKKNPDWYWTVGIISAALVITAVIFGNVLFGLVIAIGAFTLMLFSARKPKLIAVEATSKGIRVDKVHYPYASLESFGLDLEHHHGPKLFLKSKKIVMPLITIPLRMDDIDGLRVLLAKHLKEETFEQNLMQSVFERLGF
jgi:hypothetical protein